ncbi:peptide chain release factor H [Paludibacterium paludis]|uniref:Peptide chain release factor-like protein n=1 Tax=Paludibacterium paludis TaxID=1225769 RepID=A0A918U7C7_9NEIS|nr:peptide chain release factor H [Paludibacterium paludis]GGY05003.1 peptide chain release factor-like protein [Paludibacterium paludis]
MLLVEISAAQGPLECARAAHKALHRLLFEAEQAGVRAHVVEQGPGEKQGTCLSAPLKLEGDAAQALAARWQGTVQWSCASPYRPHLPRKNRFIGVAVYREPPPAKSGAIRFEACRASEPGGQHVNKTDSASRATHSASGISVKVQAERGQHANKRLAVLLIEQKLAQKAEQSKGELRAQRRLLHQDVERGNPCRVFRGERFEPVK